MDHSKIEKGVSLILDGLGVNSDDLNFKDTPSRVARAYQEILGGMENTEKQIKEILSSSFPSEFSQMVLLNNIRAFSFCPHHLLPVDYQVTVAYIPSENGEVLGISKLGRLVTTLAKRPVLQEQLTEDITKHLMGIKGVVGAGCVVKGIHYCMVMRGAKQSEAVTITSSLKGSILTDEKARNEFTFLSNENFHR